MKDIHVFLLDYSDPSAMMRALKSLESIHHRIRGITIFDYGNLSRADLPLFTNPVEYHNLDGQDLGEALNQSIQSLTSEYVLFLSDQDCLTANIKHIPFELNPSQPVLTHPYRIRDIVVQRPLLVKTSVLKVKKLLSLRQVPFKEALLPSWLLLLHESEMIMLKENVVKQATKRVNATVLQKQHVLKKYHDKPHPSREKQPSIAVILSSYNMKQYIEAAITSSVWQHEPADQILIIDDGSTDGSYELLEKWKNHPKIQLFRKENGGKARALNMLLPHVRTDFVLELDADDWLDPDAFATIKRHLRDLSNQATVLYGNLKVWKQMSSGDIQFKGIQKGRPVNNKQELLAYRFPLGPRIYRTSCLIENGGFPVIDFEDGRLYEDVSVLNDLLKKGPLQYRDFTVYHVREHNHSITKKNHSKWNDFIQSLN